MTLDRRAFIKAVAAGAVAAAAPRLSRAINCASANCRPMESYPTVIARESGRLRLLLATDLHYCAHPGRQDLRTSDHLRRMTDKFQPDAVIVCGDMWYENPEGKGLSFCEFACGEMGKLGVPWAFARGNHDTVSPEHDDRARELLASARNSLYARNAWQDCYRVEVKSPGAGRLFWNLYLLNNAYPKLRGFRREQLEWFGREAARVRELYGADLPAFACFHIPLPEWQDAIANRSARGVKLEKVSIEDGSAGAFEALAAPDQVRAMFCGHDHVNNFHGTLKGVYIEYVRGTGQGSYGGMRLRKGATLAEVDTTGPEPVFHTATVLPSGKKFTFQRRVIEWGPGRKA